MAYTDIDDPSAYFQTKLYTGTNNELVLTFDGNSDLQTDMIWTKNRSRSSTNHVLSDTARGIGKGLYPDLTNAEGDTNYVSAISSDGYTIVATDSVEINRLNDTFVSWNWKAGTAFSNDASSTSVGSIDSAGSVNTDAGISVITFTGTGANATVAHGLGVIPKFFVIKSRSNANGWIVYHGSLGAGKAISWNLADAAFATGSRWNSTEPTSTVFSLGSAADVNRSSGTHVCYAFAEKQGYSKFGTYTGNANADGPFVYTGFKPAFFIYKTSDTANEEWKILDNKRDPFNRGSQNNLNVHTNTAESDDANSIGEFVSNGVKIRSAHNNINKSGDKFIYLAFAENPFVTSTGIPTTAR
jgi:hypothetical protein